MKNYIILAVVIFIGYILIAYQYDSKESGRHQSSTDQKTILTKESLSKLQSQSAYNQLSSQEKLDRVYQVLETLPPEYNAIKHQYKIALSTLPDITFYGRVIDQYNQPVQNAHIWYEATNTYLSAGGGRGEAQTDSQGFFMIESVGASLSIGSVSHSEISHVSYNAPNYDNTSLSARTGSISFSGSKDSQNINPNWRDHNNKDNAYIIQAWRLGTYEGTIGKNLRAGYNRTGKVYTLNLSGKNYKQIILEGEHPGHLRVSCTRDSMNNSNDYGNWSTNITPISGGIQETTDLYMNLAPEAGYQPSLDIQMNRNDTNYSHQLLNKKYYFTSNNGKQYGSLFVHFEPHTKYEDDHICIIDITYKINPTGSRNLELRKEKSSQPQLAAPNQLALN